MMPHLLPAPLLAVDVGAVISVAILIIGFLGWIRQQVANAQPQAPPPRPPRPPRRDERIQNEIDLFLQEVGGKRPERPQEVPIEIVAEAERGDRPPGPRGRRPARRPESPRSREGAPRSASSRPLAGSGTEAPPRRGSQPLSERQIDMPADFGPDSSMQRPLVAAMGGSERSMQERLSHEIGQLAARRSSTESDAIAVNRSQRLAAILRDPAGVRQAIMINELLARPKALRRND